MTLTSRQVAEAARLAERQLLCLRRSHGAPGVAYGLTHDGTTVLLGADGVEDLATQVPVDVETTRFRCASITKTFTATLVLQQVERGRVRLDDPVTARLPWACGVLDEELTVRHLLMHAGSVIRDGSNAWEDRTMPDREALHAELEARATFGEPSERFRYSNMAYALLGEVLESVTRTSFSSLLRREIARPLGLAATDADLTPGGLRALATGYYAAWPGEPRRAAAHVPAMAVAPAGGLVSTVGDLLEYQQAQLPGDDRLLGEVSKREMQRPQWQRAGEPHYGLGWMCYRSGGFRLVGHSGGFPGFTTRIAFAPEERLCAAVLTNVIDSVAELGTLALYGAISAVRGAWDGLAAPSRWHPRSSLERFGGIYRGDWGAMIVGRVHNGLMLTSSDDPGFEVAATLVPTGPLRFLVATGNDFGFLGEEIRFRADRRGRVTTLLWGAHALPRADF